MDSQQFRPRTAGTFLAPLLASLALVAGCILDGPVSSQLESVCSQFRVIDLDSLIPDTVGIDDSLLLSVQTTRECLDAPATRFLWSTSDETKAVVAVVPGDTAAFVRGLSLDDGAEFTDIEILARLIAPDLDTGYVVVHPVTVVPKLVTTDVLHPGTDVAIDTSLDIGAQFEVKVQVHNSVGRLQTANHRIKLELGFRTDDGTFIRVFDFAEDTSGNKIGSFLPGSIDRFAVSGEAVFSNLRIFTPGIGYQLRASSGGLTKALSRPFDIGFVRPEFDVQPSDTTAGAPVLPAVTVRVFDERDMAVTDVQSDAILTLTGPNSANEVLDIQSFNAGVATFSDIRICKPSAGYRLVVALTTVGSLTDTSDPFAVSVGPADVDSSVSTVPPGDLVDETLITLRANDRCGNPREGGEDSVMVDITGANRTSLVMTHEGGNRYEARYQPIDPGVDSVVITLNGTAVTGSPFESPVGTGGVASRSTATVPGNATAGMPTAIHVVIRDKNDRQVPRGGDDVVVTVSGANSATPTVVDSGNGAYSASYTPTVAGQDIIEIFLNGLPIQDSPFTSDVAEGPADPGNSTAAVPANGTTTTTTNITVTVNDAFGNPVSGATVTVVITAASANPGSLNVNDNSDGTYSASYAPSVDGSDTIVIEVDGTAINGSPFTSVVSIGSPPR